eukprot:TRINITY_DN1618_c0_g1_i1.p1 TRINITY_DN1618_c0_g1~~TRINITY_DN1618_c0_g1_i1.p1  ORF type:complete len:373 (+),score=49.24 TRINITY_DN1618_c0_g1_i1:66-1184(+)
MAASSAAVPASSAAVAPNVEEEPDCGICLDKVSIRGVLDSCDHAFCFECIFRWSKESNTCPMCKQRFHQLQKTQPKSDGNAASEVSESSHKSPRRKVGSNPHKSRKRKRGETNVDADVVTIPHRDQRPDFYQTSISDVFELINGGAGPGAGRRGAGFPLFHFVGLPFGLMRPRPASRRSSEHPIHIDDDDDDSDGDRDNLISDDDRPSRRLHRARSSDESMVDVDDDDDGVGYGAFMGGPFAPRHFMNAILDRMAAISALARPQAPSPPPRPLRHIQEGDRTIIDLTDDDPEPSLSAVPSRTSRPISRSTSNITEVITVIDDDDDGFVAEPTVPGQRFQAAPSVAAQPEAEAPPPEATRAVRRSRRQVRTED